jgi:hypothetical protein
MFEVSSKEDAEVRIPQLVKNAKMVTTDGLSKLKDQLHYDTQGELELNRTTRHWYTWLDHSLLSC